ncbi:MAG: o-succinylbenzoate synthase [Anaerolineae bacterium]|nr:o-succinylbenzoate synthase [Thermoflexales bacterium]MDW8396655.1 o-succinylbenzoate synthase [Anaerolineae bacterium]
MDNPFTLDTIELFHIRIPLRAPFATSFGVTTDRETILLRAITADGLEGWGEWAGDGPGYSYETVQTAWHILNDYLIPLALKAPWNDPRSAVERFGAVRGHNITKATLEAALWDIAARRAGVSLRAFLSAVTRQPTRDRVPVGVSIGIQPSPEALVEQVGRYLEQGYRRIKIKIKPGRDIADARAVRQAFPNALLMVDANSAYSLDDAPVLKQLDDLDLLMIEQPLGYDDIYQHSLLQPQLKTPICLDESIHSPDHARAALALGACRIINIKQGRSGGLTQAVEIHDLCQAQHVPVWCGGMLETGIGRALNLALASLPNFTLPGDLSASARYYERDVVDPPFVLNPDGTLSVPEGTGLGVQVDFGYIAQISLRREQQRG